MIITLKDILYTFNNCDNVSIATKKIYQTYINKLNTWNTDLVFNNDDELVNIFTSHNLNASQIYTMLGLLRCTCVVCKLPDDVKDVVYRLYKIYNSKSKNEQLSNRFVSKWTVDSLIEFNRTLQFNSYENMVAKLIIGLYTLIPPLRNDYNNVKIVEGDFQSLDNYYNKDTGELHIYSAKSKKEHSVIVPEELKRIISDSIIYYPREYLFVSKRGKIFTNNTDMYSKLMKHVKNILGENKFTINTFRHLYAVKSFKGTVEDRVAAQEGMLHNAFNHMRYGY